MHTVYTIPMLRLSVHSVHQCAPPISLMTSDPAQRRQPVVMLHVGPGEEVPARILGNGEIPTPLRDLIKDVQTLLPSPHLTSIDWSFVSAVRPDDSAVAPSALSPFLLQDETGGGGGGYP